MKTKKFYAYFLPRTNAKDVTDDWSECEHIVKGEQDARYKSFKTEEEAQQWLEKGADYRIKKELPPGIYFDAGTGRGEGVEISVTNEKGHDLLDEALERNLINKHGKHLLGTEVSNNYGELLACYYALNLALKKNILYVYGDSKLIIDYWSKGYIKETVAKETIELAEKVKSLRWKFELEGGAIERIDGADNPADLGFH